ncbi:MAG: branched-chain amino acid aminotransferase [Acholeplasmatales bacterium]|nr:branched-chain amino acid aminotransferase [Acholeplasmatales bacterium]
MLNIKFEKAAKLKDKPDQNNLGFGKYFTDYMFIMDWDDGKGWHDARIVPYGPLQMSPASTCLHYGAEIFEGMKAYRTKSGKIQLFRPYENAKRLNSSADRLCLPLLDEDDFVQAVDALVNIDRDWVPTNEGTSLYVRPFMIGDDHTLGVHGVHHAMFMVILCPVGSYYKEGLNPVSIMIETEDERVAGKGGTGYTKCGGNYAASTRAGKKAELKGYSQVLWLDCVYKKYIEEVGAMNVMFKINGEVVTPSLIGSVLPGITRKSCIQILKEKNIPVTEKRITLDELTEAVENGTLEEAWGTGTAAVISPIGLLEVNGKKYVINNGKIGAVSQMLYDEITGIQSGKLEDRFGWTYEVK